MSDFSQASDVTLPFRAAVLDYAQRASLDKRQVGGLPVKPLYMSAPVTAADFVRGATFPAERLIPRQARLGMWSRLYYGDFTDFIADPLAARVILNYFARVPEHMAQVVVSTLDDAAVTDAAMAAAVCMVRDGRGVLVRLDDDVFAPDMQQCFIDADEEILFLATPFISSVNRTGLPDQMTISAVPRLGEALTWTVEWKATTSRSDIGQGAIGEVVTAPVSSDGAWQAADRPPKSRGQWGTSMFPMLLHPVLEIAVRLSSRSGSLDLHEHPTLWLDTPQLDAPFLTDGSNIAQNPAAAQKQMSKLLGLDLVYGAEMSPPEYVTASLDFGASLEQVHFLREELRVLSAVIGGIESRAQGAVPSGVALAEMKQEEYWAIKPIYERLAAAMLHVAGVDWPSPFLAEESRQPNEDPDAAAEQDAEQVSDNEQDAMT